MSGWQSGYAPACRAEYRGSNPLPDFQKNQTKLEVNRLTLKLYNTMTREKEEFKPREKDEVKMYTCGQTIYDDLHVGNARTYSNWDVLNRYLTWKDYDVFHVLNITDVGHLTDDADQGEDKVEKSAEEKGLEPRELVTRKIREFYKELDALNIKQHNVNPRATGHIPEMVEAVENIIENGYGYEKNGSVYFDVEKFNEDHGYAEMSGKNIEELKAGAGGRVCEEEMQEKKSPLDFALWIKADPGHLMKWNSPWSKGYPGWHLECSVMSTKYLGEHFDIHGGGVDHIFPHHPNERAQNYAMNDLDKEPVNYWIHSEFLTVEGEKMSKSKGNFHTVKELLEKYDGETLRMLFSSSHYRRQMDFSEESIEDARNKLDKLYNTLYSIKMSDGGEKTDLEQEIEKVKEEFEEAMDDDLNTPEALSALLQFSKEINKSLDNKKEILQEAGDILKELGGVLGLELDLSKKEGTGTESEELIDLLVEIRDRLRENEEYELSDEIRSKLRELDIEIQDTDEGTKWKEV